MNTDTYLGELNDTAQFTSLCAWLSDMNQDLKDSGCSDRYSIRTEDLGKLVPKQIYLRKEK